MPDVFTKEKRSAVMSRIRGSGNKDTELRMIALFREHGIRGWRRNAAMFGKPDFIFPKQRVAVFVDGCFWHRHPGCKFAYTPKSRLEFWLPKFERNIARDRLVTRTLRQRGWRVLRVWECQLAAKQWSRLARQIERVRRLHEDKRKEERPSGRVRTLARRRGVNKPATGSARRVAEAGSGSRGVGIH